MIKQERYKRILQLLDTQEFVAINDIADLLNVSGMTVRRDVNELQETNKLIRVHGGIQKVKNKDKELTTNEKIKLHKKEKEYIGKKINELIEDDSSIYLGAGTTILYALPHLKKNNLFIITNSLIAFNYLIQQTDYHVVLTGGDFNKNTEEFLGTIAEKSLENINLDYAFIATNGIFKNNVTTSSIEEGNIQNAAMKKSKRKVLVADSTKFNTSDLYTFSKLEEIDYVITDKRLEEHLFDYYAKYVKILN